MPKLQQLVEGGSKCQTKHAFPCVTWPSQATLLTGKSPREHGVVANGFYWRDKQKVEMWTAWNEVIQQPQIWDLLKEKRKSSAAWFPMLSKGSGAEYVCMPAPIHKPDGSEELWCYTKPQEFYGKLLEDYGHFPLQHFWGPLANIKSSQWIADSAVACANEFKPDFFYVYLPHLDYAAQKFGPDSQQALEAICELDELLGDLFQKLNLALGDPVWIVHSEYAITTVDHVSYPNRVLRNAGLLNVFERDDDPEKEHLDLEASRAWALVDHQFSHVFVKDRDRNTIENVRSLFENCDGIDKVLVGQERGDLDHERSGDIVLVSAANSWQAYYWWLENERAPSFARTVDIHRKPGYDPVELCFDMATKSVPLDATLIKGSHGVPQPDGEELGITLCSDKSLLESGVMSETQIFGAVMRYFE